MKKLTYSLILLFLFISLKEVYAIDPPTLITPPNNATNVPIPVYFDWTDVGGATGYSIKIWLGFNPIFYQGGIVQSNFTSPSGLLQGGTQYRWQVCAFGSPTDSGCSSIWAFTTGGALPPAPVLLFPPNDTTNMPLSFTFDWQDITPVNFYTLQITTDPTFNSISWTFPGLTSSQFTITEPGYLNRSTVYFWRVKATNTTGEGPFSAIWKFATLPEVPPPPTLQSPANNATNVTLTPLLNWTDVPVGTVNYDVQIATNSNFGTIIYFANDLDSSQKFVPSGTLSGSTQYWWRVRTKNIGGAGNWSVVFTFTTQQGPPAPPVLVSPFDLDTNVIRQPTYIWNPVAGATQYRIQVSTNSGFTSFITNLVVTGVSEYTSTVILNFNTWHYWRVYAINAIGQSGPSTVWSFRTIPTAPGVPILISPCGGITGVTLTPLLDWTSIPAALQYRIQVSTSPAFTPVIYTTLTDTTSQYQIPPGVLQGQTHYYWRVQSINAGGSSAYSTPCDFTTKATLKLGLKVYLEGFFNGTTQVQDTARIYLANTSAPITFKDSVISYLNSNGTDTISFENVTTGNYYLVVKHRNHLETWSALPQSFTLGNITNYDFTTGANKAYGNNMKQVGSAWVLYGGDADQSGIVFEADYILFRIQFGTDGYRSCDLNGDTFVDGYDLPILYNNIGKDKKRP